MTQITSLWTQKYNFEVDGPMWHLPTSWWIFGAFYSFWILQGNLSRKLWLREFLTEYKSFGLGSFLSVIKGSFDLGVLRTIANMVRYTTKSQGWLGNISEVFSPAKNKEPFIPLFLLFSCLVLLVRGDISYVRTCYGHKVCQITMFLSLSNNTLIMAATFELPVSSSIYLRDHKKKS